MKKLVLVLVLAALVAGGAFAQIEMSVGGGGILDMSFGNGIKDKDNTYGNNNTSFGGFVFFDITYAQIEVDYLYGSLEQTFNGVKVSGWKGTFNQFGIGLLGKYPIDLGAVTLFPLIGINYNMVMSYEQNGVKYTGYWANSVDGYKLYKISEYFSQLGILAGLGFDIGITEQIFIRAEALFQLRLPNKGMKDRAEYWDKVYNDTNTTTLGLGPRIKIGVGYKL